MSSFSKAAIDTISKYKEGRQGIPFVAKQVLQLRIITGLSLGSNYSSVWWNCSTERKGRLSGLLRCSTLRALPEMEQLQSRS